METRRARPLLGTFVDIRVASLAASSALDAINAAFDEIAEIHRLMSFHEPGSDLSHLHRDAWRTPVRVDTRTIEVIALALGFARESQGRFDPTVASALVAADFLPRPPHSPVPSPGANWRSIVIGDSQYIRFAQPLWLDLGGIAKGYAVDRAIACLQSHGVRTALVNAGGDLRRIGPGCERIHVRDPAAPLHLRALLDLGEGAVATSGGYFPQRDINRRRVGACIDGATRVAIDVDATVSVLADTCAEADALTKIVLADPAIAASVLSAHGAQAIRGHGDAWVRVDAAA